MKNLLAAMTATCRRDDLRLLGSEAASFRDVRRLSQAIFIAAAALAASTVAASAHDAPHLYGDKKELRYEVSGFIPSKCLMAQDSKSGDFGEILDPQVGGNLAKELTLNFNIDCNSLFDLRVETSEGGLKLETGQKAQGFRSLLPYKIKVNLPSEGVAIDCDSLKAKASAPKSDCAYRSQRQRTLSGRGSITLTMAKDPTPILAGRYTDKLTLRISPRIGG